MTLRTQHIRQLILWTGAFVLFASVGWPLWGHAAPSTNVNILFTHEIAAEPSQRVEFAITYWEPIAVGNCSDFSETTTELLLNNHQRSLARDLAPGTYCISHELRDASGNGYQSSQLTCTSINGQAYYPFDDFGSVTFPAGEKVRCTAEAIFIGSE